MQTYLFLIELTPVARVSLEAVVFSWTQAYWSIFVAPGEETLLCKAEQKDFSHVLLLQNPEAYKAPGK